MEPNGRAALVTGGSGPGAADAAAVVGGTTVGRDGALRLPPK